MIIIMKELRHFKVDVGVLFMKKSHIAKKIINSKI